MKSLYFDDSLAENELHYKIKQYLDEHPLEDEWEEIHIKCDNMEQYNSMLDSLFHASEGKFRIFGTTNEDIEIIVMDDPRNNYRKFDEKNLIENKDSI